MARRVLGHDWTVLILVISFGFLVRFGAINRYTAPPGTDPGSWLALAHIYLTGDTSFIWFPAPGHPPLFPIVLGFLAMLLGDLFALKIMGALSFTLMALPTYLMVKHYSSKSFAFAAALLTIFNDAYMEMTGWGAYMNAFALTFTFTAFYFIMLGIEGGRKRDLVLAGFFSALIGLTHHLTALVFFAIIIIYLLLELAIGSKRKSVLIPTSFSVLCCILTLAPFIIMVYSSVPPVVFNEAAFFKRRATLGGLAYVYRYFTSWALLPLGIFGIGKLYKDQRKDFSMFLLSWALVPFLLTQLYLVGLPTDYSRFLFYSIQPLIIATTYILFILNRKNPHLVQQKGNIKLSNIRHLKKLVFVIFTVMYIISAMAFGFRHLYFAADWYQNIKESDYELLMWIKNNTPKDSVIVATSYHDYWITGLTHRKVLSAHPLEWVFTEGEAEMSRSASLILFGTYEIDNGYIRARGMEPCEGTATPLIGVKWQGEYQDIFFLQDSFTIVKFNNEESIPLFSWESEGTNRTSTWIKRGSEEAIYQTIYGLGHLEIKKSVSIKYGIPVVEITYEVNGTSNVEEIDLMGFIWYDFHMENFSIGNETFMLTDKKTVVFIALTNSRSISLNPPYIHLKFKPETFKITIYAEPKTLSKPITVRTLDAYELIERYNVTHILSRGLLDAGYNPRFIADKKHFKIAYENEAGSIFEIEKDG